MPWKEPERRSASMRLALCGSSAPKPPASPAPKPKTEPARRPMPFTLDTKPLSVSKAPPAVSTTSLGVVFVIRALLME